MRKCFPRQTFSFKMSRVSEPREDPEGLEGRESKMQQCHRGRVGGGGETDRQTESVPPRNGGGGGSIHLLLQRIGLHPWELSSWETCTCARSVMSDSVTPWTVAHQAPPSMGFSGHEYCSGLPLPSPGDLSNPGIEPVSLESPALGGEFFATGRT